MVRELLTSTVTVRRREVTADDMGGDVVSWRDVMDDYRCRIYRSAGELVRDASGEQAVSTHRLFGEAREVRAGDHIVDGGQAYIVLAPDWPANVVRTPRGPHHVEAYLRAMRSPA
jgi:head-tail adaptor